MVVGVGERVFRLGVMGGLGEADVRIGEGLRNELGFWGVRLLLRAVRQGVLGWIY